MTIHKENCYAALVHALNDGHVTPVFQPIWTIAGECLGYEALSRFPNGCPPDAVWALAQEQGVAAALDTVALAVAVDAAQELPGHLFLNISAIHLAKPAALIRFGAPERIVWEVTETGLISADGLQGIRWLKTQGYRVAMDDAGSGYSTERRLRALRPHVVKLDHHVVHGWKAGRTDSLQRWVAAAQEIHALVLAEGVEDADWVPGLEAHGVHAVQGYAWGKPAPADQWLAVSLPFFEV